MCPRGDLNTETGAISPDRGNHAIRIQDRILVFKYFVRCPARDLETSCICARIYRFATAGPDRRWTSGSPCRMARTVLFPVTLLSRCLSCQSWIEDACLGMALALACHSTTTICHQVVVSVRRRARGAVPGGRFPVPSKRGGKVVAGTAGIVGTSGVGVMVAAVTRAASAQVAPAGMWAVMTSLVASAVAVAGLALVLDYRRSRLQIVARQEEARSRMDLARERTMAYLALVEKSVGDPGSAPRYRALILADALHLAVEQNGVRLADLMYGQLNSMGGTEGYAWVGVPGHVAPGHAGERRLAGCHRCGPRIHNVM
jgi:hypothetical protein